MSGTRRRSLPLLQHKNEDGEINVASKTARGRATVSSSSSSSSVYIYIYTLSRLYTRIYRYSSCLCVRDARSLPLSPLSLTHQFLRVYVDHNFRFSLSLSLHPLISSLLSQPRIRLIVRSRARKLTPAATHKCTRARFLLAR